MIYNGKWYFDEETMLVKNHEYEPISLNFNFTHTKNGEQLNSYTNIPPEIAKVLVETLNSFKDKEPKYVRKHNT